MSHTQYSFTLPLGFALGGGATSVAGAPAPGSLARRTGGSALLADDPGTLNGAPGPLAGGPGTLTGAPTPLATGSAPIIGAPAPLATGSAPLTGAPAPVASAILARDPAPGGAPGWPEGLPIGLRQDQERTRSREALMRSGAPPRRGRTEEGAPLSRLSPCPPDGAALQPPDPAPLPSPDPAPPRSPET